MENEQGLILYKPEPASICRQCGNYRAIWLQFIGVPTEAESIALQQIQNQPAIQCTTCLVNAINTLQKDKSDQEVDKVVNAVRKFSEDYLEELIEWEHK